MRLFGVECSLKEVQVGRYDSSEGKGLSLIDKVEVADEVLKLCEKIYQEEEMRRLSVSEKCKVLLTISAILLALLPLVLTKLSPPILSLFPTFFIFLTSYMLLAYFDIGKHSRIALDAEMWQQNSSELKVTMANDYLRCAKENMQVNNFLVDVYRVAKNSLLISLLLIMILLTSYFIKSSFTHNAKNVDPNCTTSKVIAD
jgi:hypothetical protein